MQFFLKQNRARNRPVAKMPRVQLEASIAAYERIAEASWSIRKAHNLRDRQAWGAGGKHWCGWLEPVEEGRGIIAARQRLETMGQPKAKRAAKKAAPAAALTLAQRVDAVVLAQRRHDAEGERIKAEIGEIAREAKASKELSQSRLAKRVKLTPQSLYRLAVSA